MEETTNTPKQEKKEWLAPELEVVSIVDTTLSTNAVFAANDATTNYS